MAATSAALCQELSKLSITGEASLQQLQAAAQKGPAAEPFLLQHLPSILKASSDKVRTMQHAWESPHGAPAPAGSRCGQGAAMTHPGRVEPLGGRRLPSASPDIVSK